MIRAASRTSDNRPVVMLGLTPTNVRRVRAGEPIRVDMAELGLDGVLVIFYGETERAIFAELRAHGLELPDDAEQVVRDAERVHREKGTTP